MKKKLIRNIDDNNVSSVQWTLLDFRIFSIKLQKFYRSDTNSMHENPCSYAQLVIRGHLFVETSGETRKYKAGRLSVKKAGIVHRIGLTKGITCMSLVVTFGRSITPGWQASNVIIIDKSIPLQNKVSPELRLD